MKSTWAKWFQIVMVALTLENTFFSILFVMITIHLKSDEIKLKSLENNEMWHFYLVLYGALII